MRGRDPWDAAYDGRARDGVHVHPLNTPTYYRETLLPNLAASGRDLSSFAVYVPLFTAVGDSRPAPSSTPGVALAFVGCRPRG